MQLICLQISVCFLFSTFLHSLTSSETSLSMTVYLYCYVQDGLYPLKLRARLRILSYVRRLCKNIVIIINK